jgi:hypothetical protein
MWMDDDAFLQLPHMDYDKVKEFRKKNKAMQLEIFCRMTPEERKALQIVDNPQQLADIEQAIGVFPIIDVDIKFFVEGE